MTHKIIVSLVLILLMTCSIKAQNLDSLLSHIFFNINLAKGDTSLVSEFDNNLNLKRIQLGWVAYPPLSSFADTPKLLVMEYHKNSFFPSSFNDGGRITVVVAKTRKGTFLTSVNLSTSTLNITSGDSTYLYLERSLTKCSKKKWKEKGLDGAHTLTHYTEDNKNKKVELMKYKSSIDPTKEGVRISIKVTYPDTI